MADSSPAPPRLFRTGLASKIIYQTRVLHIFVKIYSHVNFLAVEKMLRKAKSGGILIF
jgi:hypothetical protein